MSFAKWRPFCPGRYWLLLLLVMRLHDAAIFGEYVAFYRRMCWHWITSHHWLLLIGIHRSTATCGFLLTHWGRDKMAAVSQTTVWNAFSWMKMYQIWLRFHWSVIRREQITIFQHWFRWSLGAVQATSHYLNRWWSVFRRIYASLGLNELEKAVMSLFWRHCIDWIEHD